MNNKNLVIVLINFYQRFLSFDGGVLAVFAPGGACKYEIRCSEYTKQMIINFGVVKGSWLGVQRIWGCR